MPLSLSWPALMPVTPQVRPQERGNGVEEVRVRAQEGAKAEAA
jgi:hypothetical protein